jgi:hypothetical protein
MSEDLMDYQALVEGAMRTVVREALRRVAADGLPGDHHMYITFRTQAPDVDIASRLVAQYPDEMTIVIQHQFWGLDVAEDAFEITLSFSGKNERLHIPLDAVTGFADPSVNFGLQFKAPETDEDEDEDTEEVAGLLEDAGAPDERTGETDPDDPPKSGEVVALDAFRKKK